MRLPKTVFDHDQKDLNMIGLVLVHDDSVGNHRDDDDYLEVRRHCYAVDRYVLLSEMLRTVARCSSELLCC